MAKKPKNPIALYAQGGQWRQWWRNGEVYSMGDLITLAEYELYVQTKYPENPSFDDEDADLLAFLISSSSEKIQKICNRLFILAEYTEQVDGHNTVVLNLSQSPIVGLTSVVSLNNDGTTANTYDLDFIRIDRAASILYSTSTHFPMGFLNISVEYSAGYEIENVPPDLKEICMEIVNRSFNNNKTKDNTLIEEKIGDHTIKRGSATVAVDITTDDYARLQEWIRIV